MHHAPRRCLIFAAVIVLLAGCVTPTPPPTAIPTEPPTSTAVPSMATSVPTKTPIPPTKTPAPAAKIKDLVLSLEPAFTTPQGDNAEFDFGQFVLYAQVEYQGMPEQFNFPWLLAREDETIAEGTVRPTQSTGMLTFTVVAPSVLLPGNYHLILRAFNQLIDHRFKIVADHVQPDTTILTETFSDDSNGWDLFSAAYGTTRISDGQLRIRLLEQNSWVSGLLNLDMADLDLTLDVDFAGPPYSAAYVFFRMTDGSGYVLSLSSNGDWMVNKVVADDYELLSDWQASDAFNDREVNQVRIVTTGDQMAFYLNDALLGTLVDSDYTHGAIRLGAGSGDATGMTVSFDNLVLRTPGEPLTIAATSIPRPRPTATATRKPISVTPRATSTPKPPAAPPLRDAIIKARDAVEAIGGAMDRIYQGSGGEACAPFMANYLTISNSPTYDVSAQPGNVQTAYAQYRQGVELVPASKISQIAKICLQGGGSIGNLDFNEARQAVNTVGGLLTQALASLGQ